MRFTIFDSNGNIYDVLSNIWAAQALARQIGGFAMDDEGNYL